MNNSDFRAQVEQLVAAIPSGKVMTYGQIAALCSKPRAARIVGGIAHYGNPDLPWHRVVNKQGGLARGYPGGRRTQAQHLTNEGVKVSSDYQIDIDKFLWRSGKVNSEQPMIKKSDMPQGPLVAVVGQTASGKSAIAMQLAEEFTGEIIAADSWTVRRQLDIGTAKPSLIERSRVPHHLIDIVDPCGDFTAVEFQRLARQAIQDISMRNRVPLLVGGTGLYIDSILYDYSFSPKGTELQRERYNQMTIEQLIQEATARQLNLESIDICNKRRIIRLLETDGYVPKKQPLRADTLIIGIKYPKEQLLTQIETRVERMVQAGLEKEARYLSEHYGWGCEGLKGIGYIEWRDYFLAQQSLEQTKQRIIQATRQLAKRQNTWFKRNQDIIWCSSIDDVRQQMYTFLSRY